MKHTQEQKKKKKEKYLCSECHLNKVDHPDVLCKSCQEFYLGGESQCLKD